MFFAEKVYYIVESFHKHIGGLGTVRRIKGCYTTKEEAEKHKPEDTNHSVYWVSSIRKELYREDEDERS